MPLDLYSHSAFGQLSFYRVYALFNDIANRPCMSVYGLLLFCKHPFLGFWVRLLTYIRSLTAAPVMVLDHNGLFARRFPIAFSGCCAADIFGFYQRRFDLLTFNGLSCNRGWTLLLAQLLSSTFNLLPGWVGNPIPW